MISFVEALYKSVSQMCLGKSNDRAAIFVFRSAKIHT